MESQKFKKYTAAQQQAVLVDVPAMGVSAAAEKHVIPRACVSRWATAAGIKRTSSKVASAATATTTTTPLEITPTLASSTQRSEAVVSSVPVSEAAATPTTTTTPTPAAPATPAAIQRVAKLYTPSQKAMILEDVTKLGVTAAAAKHGVSRFSVHDWRKRVSKAAKGNGPSPTSGPSPKDIEQRRDSEILEEWKTQPGLGPSQIKNQLRRNGIKTSVHTVRRVMEDAGYRPPKVERQKHDRSFEAVRPNHLWHLDFVQRFIGTARTFTLILIDDHARYVVG